MPYIGCLPSTYLTYVVARQFIMHQTDSSFSFLYLLFSSSFCVLVHFFRIWFVQIKLFSAVSCLLYDKWTCTCTKRIVSHLLFVMWLVCWTFRLPHFGSLDVHIPFLTAVLLKIRVFFWKWCCVIGWVVPDVTYALWSFKMLGTTHPLAASRPARLRSSYYILCNLLGGTPKYRRFLLMTGPIWNVEFII